ncbi:hypothetical protein HHI36_008608 [Cryptolaemus montrouzieri]|uniref:Uncharacterized protein n=1 Tax=Cryptolaemus montrouzieri TaxID=559131 RepID=A0ABD2MT56_9CUCU
MLKRELNELTTKINETENYGKIKAEFDLLNKEYNQLTEQLRELSECKDGENSMKDMLILKEDIEAFWHIYKTKAINKELMEIKIASWINHINLNCITLRKIMESETFLKKKTDELTTNLRESEKEVVKLTEIIEDVNNSKIILEGEKSGLEIELKDLKNELDHKNKKVEELTQEIAIIKTEDKNVTIQTLEDASQHLEEAKEELMKYQNELVEKCENIREYKTEIERLKSEVEDKNLI